MKNKAVLLIILATIVCSICFVSCHTNEPKTPQDGDQELDDGVFEDGVQPLDESFLFDLTGMDKTAGNAKVLLMPAPYGEKCLSVKGQILSVTVDKDLITGQYVLYYCVEEDGIFNVYKLTSQDGENWNNDGNTQKYFTAQGVATVVDGAASVYVEKSDDVSMKSIDGSVNISLGVDNTAFVSSAFYKDGVYYVYTSDSEGNTFVSIVKDGGVTVTKINDTA